MLILPSTFKPDSGGFAPFVRSLSSGQALDGTEQIQTQLHDRWTAAFQFSLRSSTQILAMRSFVTQMRGRSNTVALPTFDLRAPWAVDAYGVIQNPKWARSRSLDDTPYEDDAGLVDSLIAATLNASAAINATSVAINIATGSAPSPGMQFSLGNRLYAINSVASVGSVHTCGIWPWLRVAATSGDTVNFTSPKCEMRFATDGEGQDVFSGLTARRFGTVTLRFDEVAPS